MDITSLQNPKIKSTLKLRDRSERDATGLFLIEGYREIKRAVEHGIVLESLFICPEFFLGENEEALISKTKASVFTCTRPVFEKLSYRDRPDGLLAVAAQMDRKLASLKLSPTPLLIVAEAIEKPGNLGTILRSADGVKVDGAVICDRCTDIYNPNVVRASVGTLFTVPVIEAGGDETLDWLKKNQIQIVAATPHAKIEYTQANFRKGVAVVVGTEQYGLSKKWMEAADIQVRIPMLGDADSLNVATAATLLLYEVLRQRRS